MRTTGVRDYCLIQNKANMKSKVFLLMLLIILISGCRNGSNIKDTRESGQVSAVDNRLILIGQDIITEVIVIPDTLGDPWEVEKVSGYNGLAMYR